MDGHSAETAHRTRAIEKVARAAKYIAVIAENEKASCFDEEGGMTFRGHCWAWAMLMVSMATVALAWVIS